MTDEQQTRNGAISRVSAGANDADRLGETKRWRRFKEWFCEKFKKAEQNVEEYYESGVVAAKVNTARKTVEEAAEISTRIEHQKIQSRREAFKATKEYFSLIDDIFRDDGLSTLAKKMKFAKLLEDNPDISDQLREVDSMLNELSLRKGSVIQFLPAPDHPRAEQDENE